MKRINDLSPNSSKNKRPLSQIKYVIIHYTGMQSEIESYKRLMNQKFKVSCHYLINRKGVITQMVLDHKVAWHAGKSKWKNLVNLNNNSIGIELVNKGHQFGYESFSKKQINSLISLCKNLKNKYKINAKNFLGHSDIAPLRKTDPGKKFPWKKLSKLDIGVWYKKSKEKFLFSNKDIEHLFFKNLHKIGYRYFKINKRLKKDTLIIKSFQEHYLPQDVTGKIDFKTLKISHFLANKLKLA